MALVRASLIKTGFRRGALDHGKPPACRGRHRSPRGRCGTSTWEGPKPSATAPLGPAPERVGADAHDGRGVARAVP